MNADFNRRTMRKRRRTVIDVAGAAEVEEEHGDKFENRNLG